MLLLPSFLVTSLCSMPVHHLVATLRQRLHLQLSGSCCNSSCCCTDSAEHIVLQAAAIYLAVTSYSMP